MRRIRIPGYDRSVANELLCHLKNPEAIRNANFDDADFLRIALRARLPETKMRNLVAFLVRNNVPSRRCRAITSVIDLQQKLESRWIRALTDTNNSFADNKASLLCLIDAHVREIASRAYPENTPLMFRVEQNRKRWENSRMPCGVNKKPGPKSGKRKILWEREMKKKRADSVS